MRFGQNLQFLRKMRNGMTQEELAELLNVSRQTISKWEQEAAYPEIEKAIALAGIFSCSLDQLLLDELAVCDQAYSNLRLEKVDAFHYVSYTVISQEPEGDAIRHIKDWAIQQGIQKPQIIGWDFPFVGQEQRNVYHMHGYAAACILPPEWQPACRETRIDAQDSHVYAAVTITDPMESPFSRIPNAYKTLMTYMKTNGIVHQDKQQVLSCFEKEYEKGGRPYMDVYIATDH